MRALAVVGPLILTVPGALLSACSGGGSGNEESSGEGTENVDAGDPEAGSDDDDDDVPGDSEDSSSGTEGDESGDCEPPEDCEMIEIPAGPFMMGCNPDHETPCEGISFVHETPYHEATLSAYEIDRLEVTMTDYQSCVQAGDCDATSDDCIDELGGSLEGLAEGFPAVCISWDNADAYCRWAGKRLPTEAEWEKAARGDDGRRYPWGHGALSCDRVVYASPEGTGCGEDLPHPVGERPSGASPYGVLDMAGNVLEQVSDFYSADYYGMSPAMDPQGPESGNAHPVRGGSYASAGDGNSLRTSWRGEYGTGSLSHGIRCARSL